MAHLYKYYSEYVIWMNFIDICLVNSQMSYTNCFQIFVHLDFVDYFNWSC